MFCQPQWTRDLGFVLGKIIIFDFPPRPARSGLGIPGLPFRASACLLRQGQRPAPADGAAATVARSPAHRRPAAARLRDPGASWARMGLKGESPSTKQPLPRRSATARKRGRRGVWARASAATRRCREARCRSGGGHSGSSTHGESGRCPVTQSPERLCLSKLASAGVPASCAQGRPRRQSS